MIKLAVENTKCLPERNPGGVYDLKADLAEKEYVLGYNPHNKLIRYPVKAGKLIVYPEARVLVPTGVVVKEFNASDFRITLTGSEKLSEIFGLALVNGSSNAKVSEEIVLTMINLSDTPAVIADEEVVGQFKIDSVPLVDVIITSI